jgi:hypothetical protein
MNPTNPYQRILCAFTLTLSLCFAGSLGAQDDTLIAMGVVNGSGTLVNSTNTVGGVVSILDQGIGNHDIVIDAVGAFSGSSGDYLLMVAKRDNDGFIYDTDNYVYGNVESVTADQLTATVRSQDLEDASDKPPIRMGHLLLIRITILSFEKFLRGRQRSAATPLI